MSDDLALPIASLEVSDLTKAVFAHLHLDSVGELTEVDEVTFVNAAYGVASDDQRVAPALAEVQMVLADMELALARASAPRIADKKIAADGPARPDYRYLGTFECGGSIVMGERRFIGRAVDTAKQSAGTIDFLETPPKGEVGYLQLARLVVEPGLWDVYEREPWRGGPALDVLLRLRGASEELRGRHIGGLRMPDNLVAVVSTSHTEDAVPFVRSHAKHVFDWGAVLQIARPVDDAGNPASDPSGYGWRTFTEAEDPAICALTIQAYPGDLPR